MTEDDLVDQDKFDAVLRRLIASPPTTKKEAVAQPKFKKDGALKKSSSVHKMDK